MPCFILGNLHGRGALVLKNKAVSMTTWQQQLNTFDTTRQPGIPLANVMDQQAAMDDNVNNVINQITMLRNIIEVGYTKMETACAQIDGFSNMVKQEVSDIKQMMVTNMNPDLSIGAKMDLVGARIDSMSPINTPEVVQLFDKVEQLCCRMILVLGWMVRIE